MGHATRNCTDRERGPRCFACNNYEHKAPDFTDKNRDDGKNRRTVNLVKDAVNNRAGVDIFINGTKIKPLIDTESSIILMKASECLKLNNPFRLVTIKL